MQRPTRRLAILQNFDIPSNESLKDSIRVAGGIAPYVRSPPGYTQGVLQTFCQAVNTKLVACYTQVASQALDRPVIFFRVLNFARHSA